MKKIVFKNLLFVVFLVVLLGTAGCSTVVQPTGNGTDENTNGSVADVITYVGAVTPQNEIQITPKVSGTVTTVNVDVGSQVNMDDVLCSVDDTDIALQVQQAQAQYDAAVTALNNLQNGTTVQSANQLSQAVDKAKLDVSAAQNNYDTAKANYDAHTQVNMAKTALDNATTAYNNAVTLAGNYNLAQAQTDYNDALLASQAITDENDPGYDAAQSALDAARMALAVAQTAQQTVGVAKSQMDTAKQAYNSAKLNEKSSLNAAQSALDNANLELKTARSNYDLVKNVLNPGNIDYAQTAVEAAQATLDLAQRQLDNTVIKAPIPGVISAKNVNEGMLISPATQLFTMVDLTTANIMIDVSQDDIGSMQEGKAVSISVQNTDIKDKPGTIFSVSPSADLKTGMFSVQIVVSNSDGALKGGMFADVTIAK